MATDAKQYVFCTYPVDICGFLDNEETAVVIHGYYMDSRFWNI